MTEIYKSLQDLYREACTHTIDNCKQAISLSEKKELILQGSRWKLSDFDEIAIIGWGKAAVPIIDHLIETIDSCAAVKSLAITPEQPNYAQTWFRGFHPKLNLSGIKAAKKLVNFVEALSDRSLLIAVSSGGGSANLWSPANGVDAGKKLSLVNTLLLKNLDCREFNNIRKCLSSVKAGGLLEHVNSQHIINVVISDDVRSIAYADEDASTYVASGPLVPQLLDYPAAKRTLVRLGMYSKLSKELQMVFEKKPSLRVTSKSVKSFVLVDNSTFLNHLEHGLQELGYETVKFPKPLTEQVEDVAVHLESYFRAILKQSPVALLAGGEPTCQADGDGEGGRCRHLACCLGEKLADVENVYIASFGSDGTDFTDVGGGGLIPRVDSVFRDRISTAIKEYDSGRFIETYGDVFEISSEMRTNVGDAVLLLSGSVFDKN